MSRPPLLDAVLSRLRARMAGARHTPAPSGAAPLPSLRGPSATVRGGVYPGDFHGPLHPTYDPHDDDRADPGEVVWAWVPYEEDPAKGKDRPALVVGRDGEWLLALPVTSKDHDRDADQEAAAGRFWVDLGTGGWDARGRPSEARVNRVVRLAPDAVRRIGARLDRTRFDEVCAAMARHR
ncbi:MAG: type II toxin-antitoxin system PemK/MazF family toxin [Austwickia sp.]|nr:type II toxin-antitoxin system PemK/MazF family toxin [Austwickia sp.]